MCHGIIRELLANFLSQNRKYFQPYVDGQMVEYIAKVKQSMVWGTAVELLATATLFGIPVFTFLPNGNSYHWLYYEPLQSGKFVYPQDPPPLRLLNLDHIELLNANGWHYDVIASSEGGVLDRPLLSNKIDTITLNWLYGILQQCYIWWLHETAKSFTCNIKCLYNLLMLQHIIKYTYSLNLRRQFCS